MIKEIRGLDWSEIPHQALDSRDQTRYTIGTEGCVNKFCHDMDAILLSDLSFPQGMTLVTPRVGEKIFSRFIQLLVQVCQKYVIDYIVVNDYGVLNALQKLNYEKIVLGRTLIRSLAYAPWSLNLVRDESDEIKHNLFLPNIVHSSKIEFLKKYHICAVELCATPMLEPAVEWLNKRKIEVFYHYETTIASVGRTCPYARMLNETASCCTYQCEDMLNVNIRKTWSPRTALYENVEELSGGAVPEYYNIENVLYYRTENSTVLSLNFNTVIFQLQMGNISINMKNTKLHIGE